MNIRLQNYKANRIAGMNRYNAAKAAKFSENTARHHSNRLEKGVERGIIDALEEAGITDKKISSKIKELLNAQRVISCNVFIDKDGEMKNADGKSLDFVEVPDCSVQLKTVEHINKLKGNLKETKVLVDIKAQLTINQLHDLAGSNGQKKGDNGKQVELVTRSGLTVVDEVEK